MLLLALLLVQQAEELLDPKHLLLLVVLSLAVRNPYPKPQHHLQTLVVQRHLLLDLHWQQ
jgi:hypothetical protein